MAARVAVKAREARREAAARQERLKRTLHELREIVAISPRDRLGAERLKVFEHDPVEHLLRRTARFVR